MQLPKMTRHARQRLQQRGSRPREVAIVLNHGDIEIPARDGCRFLLLSNSAAETLFRGNLGFAVQDVDRARRLAVLADSNDRIVTVLKRDPRRRFPRSNP
jgi:hypothetical protein